MPHTPSCMAWRGSFPAARCHMHRAQILLQSAHAPCTRTPDARLHREPPRGLMRQAHSDTLLVHDGTRLSSPPVADGARPLCDVHTACCSKDSWEAVARLTSPSSLNRRRPLQAVKAGSTGLLQGAKHPRPAAAHRYGARNEILHPYAMCLAAPVQSDVLTWRPRATAGPVAGGLVPGSDLGVKMRSSSDIELNLYPAEQKQVRPCRRCRRVYCTMQ